jgi:hypothetical protein
MILCVSCPGHNTASVFLSNSHKKIYKKSTCDENKPFPQMVVLPFFNNATQVVPNCKTYPKHKTALAVIIFYHHWLKWFGDEDLVVKDALEEVMIEWGLEKKSLKSAFNLKGKKIKNPSIIGLTQSNTIIWVWQGYFHKISETSLMHELVHVVLRVKNGHGDRDHEGDKYSGWTVEHSALIYEAKEMLRSFDI